MCVLDDADVRQEVFFFSFPLEPALLFPVTQGERALRNLQRKDEPESNRGYRNPHYLFEERDEIYRTVVG